MRFVRHSVLKIQQTIKRDQNSLVLNTLKKNCPPNILITIPGSIKSVGKHRTGIIVYIEYQGICPFFGNGSSQPLARKQVYLPRPWTQREGNNTRLRVRGWGDPIWTTVLYWHSANSVDIL
jgi:hypothetical protein